MRVFALKPEEIESCWEEFAILLNRFEMVCRELTVQQIVEAVRDSKMQFFGLQDQHEVRGFVVTEIHETAKGKVCVLVGACGNAPQEDKRLLFSHIEQWARGIGCSALKVIGRKGWLRWDRRFRETGRVMELCL